MTPALLALLVGTAHADPTAEVRVVTVEQGPDIDGVLDDAAWAQAEPVSDLHKFWPTDGGPPPGTTEYRFLQDGKTLYMGVTITGADYDVRARWTPREDVGADDQVAMFLDTFRDERSGYLFYTTPNRPADGPAPVERLREPGLEPGLEVQGQAFGRRLHGRGRDPLPVPQVQGV